MRLLRRHLFMYVTVATFMLSLGFSAMAFAATVQSVSMVSLADEPWTITLSADGSVVWSNRNSGFLMAEVDEPRLKEKKGTISRSLVESIFAQVEDAGYGQKRLPPVEPKIKLIVTFADGKEVINSGPGDFAGDADKKAFRDIEAALAKAAGVDRDENVLLYYAKKYGKL
jgi:hypothetical protein